MQPEDVNPPSKRTLARRKKKARDLSKIDPLTRAEGYLGLPEFQNILHYCIRPLAKWLPPGVHIRAVGEPLRIVHTALMRGVIAIDGEGNIVMLSGDRGVQGLNVIIVNGATGAYMRTDTIMSPTNPHTLGTFINSHASPSFIRWRCVCAHITRYISGSLSPPNMPTESCKTVRAPNSMFISDFGGGEQLGYTVFQREVESADGSQRDLYEKYIAHGRFIGRGWIDLDTQHICSMESNDLLAIQLININKMERTRKFSICGFGNKSAIMVAKCNEYIVTVDCAESRLVIRIYGTGDTPIYSETLYREEGVLSLFTYPGVAKFAIVRRMSSPDAHVDMLGVGYIASDNGHATSVVHIYSIEHISVGKWV